MLERVRRKRNPLALLVGMQIDTATMENSISVSLSVVYDSLCYSASGEVPR